MDPRRRDCSAHRVALIAFADRRERTAATAPALAHLDRCRQCEDELAGIVRVIAGLRRLADSVATIEPGQETWPLLRARVSRPAPVGRPWAYPASGLLAFAVVALLVVPSMAGITFRASASLAPTDISAGQGSVIIDRRYESPAGALTAGMVNAIAGQDVSRRARLRSAIDHIAPSSVDRDEPSRVSTAPAGSPDDAGMPVAITRS